MGLKYSEFHKFAINLYTVSCLLVRTSDIGELVMVFRKDEQTTGTQATTTAFTYSLSFARPIPVAIEHQLVAEMQT